MEKFFKINDVNYFYNGTSIFIVNKLGNKEYLCKARDKNNKSISDINVLKKIIKDWGKIPLMF